MRLLIVHYHFRPGGVRRVIELAAPAIARIGAFEKVTLLTGEAPPPEWLRALRRATASVAVDVIVERAVGYFSEQTAAPPEIRADAREALERSFSTGAPDEWIVWAHNLGLGRNFILARELAAICARRAIRLVSHHHDWWCDRRWHRWPEIRRSGFSTLRAAARAALPGGATIRHVAVNRADAALLQRQFGTRAQFLRNPAAIAAPGEAEIEKARRWLVRRVPRGAPVWLYPCRLLRRKNVAEALLLTRLLEPEAWLVTTSAASSADEAGYAAALEEAARAHAWPLRLGILAGASRGAPSVEALLRACDVVVTTSVQEGYGLSNAEAIAAGKPLIARRLPDLEAEMEAAGGRHMRGYDELLIDPCLFDFAAEVKRQRAGYRSLLASIPRAARKFVGTSALLARRTPAPVPFARLTLTAQLSVLAQPIEFLRKICGARNPWLAELREGAAGPRPRASDTNGACGIERFAHDFLRIATFAPPRLPPPSAAERCARDFIRVRHDAGHLFPLLWSTVPSIHDPGV